MMEFAIALRAALEVASYIARLMEIKGNGGEVTAEQLAVLEEKNEALKQAEKAARDKFASS